MAAASGAGPVGGLAERLGAQTGWRRVAVALGVGALSAAALPPFHVLPVLLVSFPALVWLIEGAPRWKTAFWVGWWFGFGHFVGGLYWISESLLVDAASWAWLIPFAVTGIPAVIAVYCGSVAAVVWFGRTTTARILLLAACWTLAEWLRGQLFTGFPWNALGTVWVFSDLAIQPAAFAGVYGLGFLTVLCAAGPASLRHGAAAATLIAPGIGLVVVSAMFVVGAARLPDAPGPTVAGIMLRIVQPNIPQRLKWRPEMRDRHLMTLLRLSGRAADRSITHLIWPESAIPFVLSSDEARRRVVASAVPEGGLLLTGAIRTTPPGVRPFRIWNSLHALAPDGRIVATYDKFHLVPFGEYVPFRSVLGLGKITAGRTDFSAGPGPRLLDLAGLPPVGPLICYEVIFPDGVVPKNARPGWLLNVTNDAWFGHSSGPYQHLAAARLRAVEQGLPLVRAANTGISAVIDPYGRLLADLDLGTQDVIDFPLPAATVNHTLYGRYGDLPVLALSLLIICAVFWAGRRDPV